MPANGKTMADYTKTRVIHAALTEAVNRKLFSKQPELQTAAQQLIKQFESDGSVFSRQSKMLEVMRKGATIQQLGKKLGASRRTVFRYLNSLEQAGYNIRLDGSRYLLDGAGGSTA